VKEYQRFSFFYNKMARYLEFDPDNIEPEIYERLPEDYKKALSSPRIVREMHLHRMRKAQKILEDEGKPPFFHINLDVNVLNFQLFQYALKILHKEKKAKMKEEEKKKQAANPEGNLKERGGSGMAKLVLLNLAFFMVIAGGILLASNNTELIGLLGGLFGGARKDDAL